MASTDAQGREWVPSGVVAPATAFTAAALRAVRVMGLTVRVRRMRRVQNSYAAPQQGALAQGQANYHHAFSACSPTSS